MLTFLLILMVLALLVGLIVVVGMMLEGPLEMMVFGQIAIFFVNVIANMLVLIFQSINEE